jgi:hypothetical protein
MKLSSFTAPPNVNHFNTDKCNPDKNLKILLRDPKSPRVQSNVSPVAVIASVRVRLEGGSVGAAVGAAVGASVGKTVGASVGETVGCHTVEHQ